MTSFKKKQVRAAQMKSILNSKSGVRGTGRVRDKAKIKDEDRF